MLLTCLVVGLISCRDTVDPRESSPASHVQKQEATGPVTVLELTCRLSFSNGEQGDVHCGEPGGGVSGVSRSVILPWYSEYAVWLPFNLVKDTSTQTWTFIASVKNLLAQPIGTLNGTTAVGSKVVVTYGPVATQGTGDVWITNADGTGNFTAPNQPYFNYPWIVQPQQISPYREMKTHVPNTVTEVTIGIAISTDFPATQSVAGTPPPTQPAWFDDDTSWVEGDSVPFPHVRGILGVNFKTSATLADRQLAAALIGAGVVGGIPIEDNGDGTYFLQVPDDGTGSQLSEAAQKLKSLPQVASTAPLGSSKPNWLQSVDGAGWQRLSLDPDSLSTGWLPWALEAINAPMAWGCSTGDQSALIGVIDHSFDQAEVAANTSGGSQLFGADPTDLSRHGAWVTSVLASRGNDSVGMTGVMWRAGLLLADVADTTKISRDAFLVDSLGAAGARIINLSRGFNWGNRRPTTAKDSAYALDQAQTYLFPSLRRARAKGHLPLVVLSAGNSNLPAFLNVYPIIRDSFPAVVVGAATRSWARWVVNADSGSNFGSYVDVYAPGAEVPVEQGGSGALVPMLGDGTSFAAPLAAGVAGLILSLDPSVPADSIRSYVIGGAQNGNRSVTDPTGTKYLLNAYESLKLAAQRPTASICGNRMWAADSQIFVQRNPSSSTGQSIYHAAAPISGLFPLHRGVINFGTGQADRHLAYENGSWSDVAGWAPDSLLGGPALSAMGDSHDADTSAFAWLDPNNYFVRVNIDDDQSVTTITPTPTIVAGLSPGDTRCLRREDSECTEYVNLRDVGSGYEGRVGTLGYSPRGDDVFIAVTSYHDINKSSEAWEDCFAPDWGWDTSFPPSTSCAVEFRGRTASAPSLTKSFVCGEIGTDASIAPMRIAHGSMRPRS